MSIDMTDHEISKYFSRIKIKKQILQKIDSFEIKNFKQNDKILGVHFRGSTYKTARGHSFPLTKNLMIKNIQFLLKKFNYDKIFVVTEEQGYLKVLKKNFQDRLIYYDSYRMKKKDSFTIYPRKKHRYLLGEEILIETVLLSKCDGLTFVKSNVITAAKMFAKKKIKLHEICLGLNTRNKFFSKYLWFLKTLVPSCLGGLKFTYKQK
jgi:Tfp pilus assembly protein PilZ